jgi:uncharacterized phage-associated protein
MARTDAKRVILEIIRLADGEFDGKTKLFKAFYFAHLEYFDKNPGILTDWPIARMPEGPGIHNSRQLFDDLKKDGSLLVENVHDGFYPEYRYRLTDKAKTLPSLPSDVTSAIQRVVDFVRDKKGAELSDYTHEHSRSWKQASDGEILDIYVDLIPDDEYEQRQKSISETEKVFEATFGG